MRQKTIGFVTLSFEGFYYGQLLKKIHSLSKEYGHRLITIRSDKWLKSLNPFAAEHVDGWLTSVYGVTQQYIEKLLKYNKPVVNIAESFEGCNSVFVDNRHGMFKAVEHLIEHGHRSIAYISRPANIDMNERFEGYKDALREYGIPFNPDLVVATENFLPSGGREVCETLLSRGVSFTAVALCVDYFASNLVECLKKSGYRVPEDIAVVGFDNEVQSALLNPPLSTVHQPVDELASKAYELLIKQMENPCNPVEAIYVKTDFIRRASCGCDYHDKKDFDNANLHIRQLTDWVLETSNVSDTICLTLPRFNPTKTLSWLKATPIKHACLGVFTEDNIGMLKTRITYNSTKKDEHREGIIPTANLFPLVEIIPTASGFLPEEIVSTVGAFPPEEIISSYFEEDEALFISTVQTESSDVGAICCSGSLSDIMHCDKLISFLYWVGSAFEKERLARKLELLAHHDALSGLPNRKLLHETLLESIEAAKQQGHKLAVVLIDLDNFKKVNDFFGHDAGDKVLIQVSEMLKKIAGNTGTAARLGGDEFVILMPHINNRDESVYLGRKIVDTVNIPFTYENINFNVTASVGISLFPENGDNPNLLLKNADVAMYKVKAKGKCNFWCFE